MTSSTTAFVGSIPALYERHLGPVLFEPYAIELAGRLPRDASRVLEIAAGTGRVSRHLLAAMSSTATLVATDLNEAMLECAASLIDDPRVTWRAADAQSLPFADASFDAVVCQFGLMFVPDKLAALREMRRVLRVGGTLLLDVWDQVARNEATVILQELVKASFPDDPPRFMDTPFSMPDPHALHALAADAGFDRIRVETITRIAESESSAHLATGFVRGNPLSHQLVERGVDVATFEAQVEAALAEKFGARPCRSAMSAHVLTATA